MKQSVKKLIEHKDPRGLNDLLVHHPELANAGITIPYDFFCQTKAHPLHRLCDAVFAGKMSDEEAISIAEVFLKNGANIDGDESDGTPLIAAASLHAELLGIFFVEKGADVDLTTENDNVSALHWAAFCGLDKLVDRLLKAGARPDEKENAHNTTPLGWAIHCLMSDDEGNKHHQVACIKLLLNAGADVKKLSKEHLDYMNALAKEDPELYELLHPEQH